MIFVVPLQVALLPIADPELNPLLIANLEVQNSTIDLLIFCVTNHKRIIQLIFQNSGKNHDDQSSILYS